MALETFSDICAKKTFACMGNVGMLDNSYFDYGFVRQFKNGSF